jgi:hypothetical protein
MGLQALDTDKATRVRALCDAIVPGSAAVAPEVYVDALLARMSEPELLAALADLDTTLEALERGKLGAVADTPAFARARALAIEAYYSDFVAAGAPGPGSYKRIGFEFPLADRVRKNWSYLGIGDG